MRRCTTPARIEGDGDAEEGGDAVDGADLEEGAVQVVEVDAGRRGDAGDDEVGGLAEDLGAGDVERRADDGEHDDEEEAGALGAQEAPEAADGAAEVAGALGGDAEAAGAHLGAALLGGDGAQLGVGVLACGVGVDGGGRVGHAALPSPSWDSTISA